MDVYDAIPTIVTTFVAIIAKISIFVFLLEIIYYTSNSFFYPLGYPQAQSLNWTSGLLISSLLSLIIGTVVGLTQFRIKRLFAYSTISHVGFILLALSISTIESTQAFVFYLIQYSISNLNAFIILITIGFSLYSYSNNNKEYKQLIDKNNSPIQLISQLRGYFYINPLLALSLTITIFSFAGIPPLLGFFAKQMVLSAAIDKGYIFLSLIAILTSVIGAVYYLNVIKEIYFYSGASTEYKINPLFKNYKLNGDIIDRNNNIIKSITFNYKNITMSSSVSITISIITLVVLLFIFMNKEWLSMGTIWPLFFLCAKEYYTRNLLLLSNTNRIASNSYLTSSPNGSLNTYNILSGTYGSFAFLNSTRHTSHLSLQISRYSTIGHNYHNKALSPWFISGYSDAEGCFNVGFQKNPNGKFYVRPLFQIQVHSKDNLLLMQIKDYLGGIGNIHTKKDKSILAVRSLDDLIKIISHFDNYPLITQKRVDFILFKEIVYKIVEGEHLSAKGLQEIVNIRASINLGLSDSFKTIFPNTVPVSRPLIENITIPHSEWMAGFVSGEGCFLVQLAKKGEGKLDSASLSFKVSQHLRDELLLRSFITFFNCGLFNYHSGKSKLGAGVFIVRNFSDIWDKILPFFKDHEIRGIKREDFEDWTKVAELIKSKDHLTEDGLEKIRVIKSGMNSLR